MHEGGKCCGEKMSNGWHGVPVCFCDLNGVNRRLFALENVQMCPGSSPAGGPARQAVFGSDYMYCSDGPALGREVSKGGWAGWVGFIR